MKSNLLVPSELHVEGIDDKHAIGSLLARHGLDYRQFGPEYEWDRPPPGYPRIKEKKGKDPMLEIMATAVRMATGRSVGFVLDADEKPANRWKSVANRLRDEGLSVPEAIPADGFVGDSHIYGTRVGVWLMPDNQRSGELEDFLEDLISREDPLLPHARTSASQAMALGALFSDGDTQKAVIHTWLAWQEEPGKRFGSAITTRYFQHDRPVARRFVDWFRDVFRIK